MNSSIMSIPELLLGESVVMTIEAATDHQLVDEHLQDCLYGESVSRIRTREGTLPRQ